MTKSHRVEVPSGVTSLESERLSKLAPTQIEYHRAALQTEEQAWRALEQAQSAYHRAAAKKDKSLEYASDTLEQLYESFNRELEEAIELNDHSQFASILNRYADLYVTLVKAVTPPSQPDFEETMASADNAANILRENAQSLQSRFSSVDVAYIPLPSWGMEPMLVPAPVLAVLQTQDGELALNLCDDSLN